MSKDHIPKISAEATARRIRAMVSEDLAERLCREEGVTKDDFHSCTPVPSREVCGVDGSNALLLESGSMGVTVYRAAQSTFFDRERVKRSLSPLFFSLIGPAEENEDFPGLYMECFGQPPGSQLGNDDRTRTAGVLRDTLEFWVTQQMAHSLSSGAILLRDGPLRVSHASHDPVLSGIARVCRDQKIDLVGVSKKTSATWGGGYPLLPSIAALADTFGIPAPWWMRIDLDMLDHTQYAQWQHGQPYVVCLHRRARALIKVDLVFGLHDQQVSEIMSRLAGCSGDGRVPGYPYPLLDAHRTVVLTSEIVEEARSDLMRRLTSSGLKRRTYEILFGDYHDEFARY
ncbi:MAG TPA: DNA double-strand break repair nuclease NurA [Methanolinea sp.]|nr:DNA double-strand break repair nuclease NurA [Methanolinea sp.]HQK55782.1 DNA double-strand break repair nuclease NurA [Methanolinea sp.]